jgi:Gpi18-like mannosyltransferase
MPVTLPQFPRFSREYAAVVSLLLAAFLVRLAFFWNQGYAGVDTTDFMLWFQHAADVGPKLFYSNNYWCDYPPFNIFFFWIFGLLSQRLSLFGTALFTYVMKLPANFFDMATALIIFIFVRKRLSFKAALLATGLYAFNPAVIFDAAVWGQFDAIYAFFLVLSLMLVLRSKPKLAVVAFLLGVLTKPQSIALAPLFFFLVWRKTDWKGFFASIIVALGTVFAVILPFQWTDNNPVAFLSKIYVGAYGTYNYNSINAFNFWAFGGMWVKETQVNFIIGWASFAALAAFALYLANKRFDTDKELIAVFAAFVLFFSFFMLPTRIHERYLFPAFGMLALMFPFIRKARPLYVVLTATCLVNQAYVLYWLNASFPYAADLTGDPVVLAVSLINLVAFVYMIMLMIGELQGRKWLLSGSSVSEPLSAVPDMEAG